LLGIRRLGEGKNTKKMGFASGKRKFFVKMLAGWGKVCNFAVG
jgi:hypothetical protein